MRNFPFRFLGVLAFSITAASSVSAQDYIRKPKPATRAVEAPSVTPIEPAVPALSNSRPVAANPNSPLTPGAEVSFMIVEDREPQPMRVIIADTGELEVPGGLGSVGVAGFTTSAAEARVQAHLESNYYKPGKGAVQIALKTLPASGQKVSKVQVSGKAGRVGSVVFYSSEIKKLSDAVLEAGPTTYSDLRKVKVTRKDKNGIEQSEVYDVQSVLDGKSSIDPVLKDGDRINIPTKSIHW